ARFTLRVSGSPDAASRGLAGVGIALSRRAELALLDWIPVDSRLCAVRLNGTVRTRKDRDTRRCLFVVSAYAPTDCRQKSSCDNHRGISLTNIVSKLLASIILRRLTIAREEQTRENQAGFRPGRGYIDHIFTLRQVLGHRHTFRRPTIIVFLDLKAAFDSVDREVLWQCLPLKGVPKKYINLIQALYSKTTGRVRAYGELSSKFLTSSGVRQGCPPSPFLFNFVIDMLLDITMSSSDFLGVDLLPGAPLTDLEYADDIVLFGEDADKMQSLLTTLSNNASMFGMRFSPLKCKMLLQDWVASAPELVIGSEVVQRVDHFTYLGSLISADGLVTDEISARIQKARLAFAKLRHLWRRRDIRLLTKGRVYRAEVRSVLLYGSNTWPLRVEDIRRLLVFDHRCLRSIARVSWDNRVSNAVVRKRVLGKDGKSIYEALKLHQLRWLGHVLRMSNYRMPRRAMFCGVGISWRKARGGQIKTWQESMKSLTSGLSHVGRCRLHGWGPRNESHQWLETLNDMAQNRFIQQETDRYSGNYSPYLLRYFVTGSVTQGRLITYHKQVAIEYSVISKRKFQRTNCFIRASFTIKNVLIIIHLMSFLSELVVGSVVRNTYERQRAKIDCVTCICIYIYIYIYIYISPFK
ncbi:Retrovirus-related Pol polyprotein from type-2 retrotransposable element R2DM, partial [Schistosoma japonicum]